MKSEMNLYALLNMIKDILDEEEFPEVCRVMDEESENVNVPKEDGSIKQVLIGEHKDLKDSNQTVSYTDHKQPQTGDDTPIAIFLGILVLALAGIGVIIWKKRKLNKKV